MPPLSITLGILLVCLGYIFWTVKAMVVTGKFRLLHISSIAIVVTNGVPIPFTTYYTNLTESSELETIWVSFFAMVVFILTSSIFQLQGFYKNRKQKKIYNLIKIIKRKKYANLWFWLFLIVGTISILRFMLFSGGISYLGVIFSSMGSIGQYYETRLDIAEAFLESGKGLGWATISTNYLLPTILFTSVYYAANRKLSKKPQVLYWITFSVTYALIAVICLTFAHRFMFFYLFLLIIMASFIYNYKGNNIEHYFLHWKKPYLVISIFLAIIATGGFLFSAISGGNFWEGVGLLLDRALLVPAGTSSYYYYLFPRAYPYRGLLQAFQMYGIVPNGGDVGFQDVAEAMTGTRFGANACFLAIGFSGAGLLGVFMVSVVYCIIASFADRLLNNVEPRLRFIGILINFYGILALISNPLYATIVSFGFGISTFIFYLIIKQRGKRNHSQKPRYGV